MHGDNDPEIAAFFASFLGEGTRQPAAAPRRDGGVANGRVRFVRPPEKQSSTRAGVASLSDGLAVGVSGAAALLRHNAAPGARVFGERAQEFNRMLEELANDVMENGGDVEVRSSRTPTPRSMPPTPPLSPTGFNTIHGRVKPTFELVDGEMMPHSALLLPLASDDDDDDYEPDEEDDPEPQESEDEDPEPQKSEELPAESSEYETDSDEDISDVEDATNVADRRYPPTDFGASRPEPEVPSNEIRVSVALNTGKTIMDKVGIDLDSSLEELFVLIEEKTKKTIEILVTRHGVKLERADLPMRWTGLQDGDRITAMDKVHPAAKDRIFQTVSPNSLAAQKFKGLFPVEFAQPVSNGAFGDAIAASIDAKPADLPMKKGIEVHSMEFDDPGEDAVEIPRLAANWMDCLSLAPLPSGALSSNRVPPIPPIVPPRPPSSEAADAIPVSGRWDIPAEMEDLGAAAVFADDVAPSKPSSAPSKVRPKMKTGPSPPVPPSSAGAVTVAGPGSPSSSRLSDLSFAPTPSRRPMAAPGGSPSEPVGLKDKQNANDAIWANIAASLEPAQTVTAGRPFLSHTASAGSLRKKLPPMAATRR